MVELNPFAALKYNPRVVDEISLVLCPPYDQITDASRKSLYNRSPFNAVRLEAGRTLASDTDNDNRNTRAANIVKKWLHEGAIVRDESDAFCLVRHHFILNGECRHLVGIIGLMGLRDYSDGSILPHENTSEYIKKDRLELMKACPANFSPIMCLYDDEEKALSETFSSIMMEEPFTTIGDSEKTSQEIWLITEHSLIFQIRNILSRKKVYIADGHHRYETALMYRDLIDGDSMSSGDAPGNFIMTFLCDADDSGLNVLPYHRLVGNLSIEQMQNILTHATDVCEMESLPQGNSSNLSQLMNRIETQNDDENLLGLVVPDKDYIKLLKIKSSVLSASRTPLELIDSWILEERVLRPVLGNSLHKHVTWIHESDSLGDELKKSEYQMAFLLSPLSMGSFRGIVESGMKLPAKSTYFYPKLPTGLAINLID